jgi:hypothetical protein
VVLAFEVLGPLSAGAGAGAGLCRGLALELAIEPVRAVEALAARVRAAAPSTPPEKLDLPREVQVLCLALFFVFCLFSCLAQALLHVHVLLSLRCAVASPTTGPLLRP